MSTLAGPFRASPQQQHVWLLDPDDRGLTYRVQCSVRITGELHVASLREAVIRVCQRHEILRTVFHISPEMAVPLQAVRQTPSLRWNVDDLTELTPERRARRWADLDCGVRLQRFKLNGGRPLRIRLVTFGSSDHRLLIAMPALCADGRSLDNLVADISHEYDALVNKRPPAALAVAPLQYADLSEVMHEALRSSGANGGEAACRKWNAIGVRTRFSHERGLDTRYEPSCVHSATAAEVGERLEAIARHRETSLDVVLLSCWQLLLWRLAGRTPVTIAVGFDGRNYEGLANAFGIYARYLPATCCAGEARSFDDLVKMLHAECWALDSSQELFSWEQIARSTGAETAWAPFAFDFYEPGAVHETAGVRLQIEDRYVCLDRSGVRLACTAKETGALSFEFHFDPSLYATEEIRRLADRWEQVLQSVMADSGAALADLDILGRHERRQLLVEFNATDKSFPSDTPFHQLFEDQAAQTPASVAAVCGPDDLTFAELNVRANRLAHYLRHLGVRAETLVAICLPRSLDVLVSVLGVLKAGAAFVPLESTDPSDRLTCIVTESQAKLIITSSSAASSLAACSANLLRLDAIASLVENRPDDNPRISINPENLAYVIYTSGSTGRPKGTLVPHRSLVNYLTWCSTVYFTHEGRGSPVFSSLSFDLTMTALLAPLLSGRTVHLMPEASGTESLLAAFGGHVKYDFVKMTPTHLTLLRQRLSIAEVARHTDILVLGGESLPVNQALEWRARAAGSILVNEYGPTETVVACCAHWLASDEPLGERVPIGRPIQNTTAYVLDDRLHLVPMGMEGELYVGGVNVSRGYLNRPALTAERFVPDPFSAVPGRRLYRTGDLVRVRGDGRLEFLGRSDEQVKVRGYRIDLGEIASTLREHPGVADAAVLVDATRPDDPQLAAYIIPDEIHAGTLRRWMQLDRTGMLANQSMCELPNGLPILHRNHGETSYLYHDIFEARHYLQNGISLGDGDCVFDVGANIGLFTLQVCTSVSNVTVFAFEPIPEIFETLTLNVAVHACSATLFPLGLSDTAGAAPFTYYPRLSLMSGRYAEAGQDAEVVRRFERHRAAGLMSDEALDEVLRAHLDGTTVECRLSTLSEIIREHHVERIDLLKLDVERSELDVLAGLGEPDWPKIRQIVAEVHDIDRVGRLTALLEQHGFKHTIDQSPALEGSNLYNVYAVRAAELQTEGVPAASDQVDRTATAWRTERQLLSDVRLHAERHLPAYMVPARWSVVEAWPLASGGKLDRAALVTSDRGRTTRLKARTPARTRLEATLCEIWAQMLNHHDVGVDDGFFELGGHSLQAIQLVSRMSDALNRKISLKLLFQHPTIAELAAAIEHLPEREVTVAKQQVDAAPAADGLVTIERRPLLSLFITSTLEAVDAAALGYIPDAFRYATGLDRDQIVREWFGDLPLITGVLTTALGRIAIITLPCFGSDLYKDSGKLVADVLSAVQIAARIGARCVSLTGLIPSATSYGRVVVEECRDRLPISISTGHATTVASVLMTLKGMLELTRRRLETEHVGCLGLGSIGNATVRVLARCLPGPATITLCDVYQKESELEELRSALSVESGGLRTVRVVASHGQVPPDFYDSTLIIGATNVPEVLDVARLRPGTLVVDDSGPPCFALDKAIERLESRGDILFTAAGAVRLPQASQRLIYLPWLAEHFGIADEITRLFSNDPLQITGCVLSSLLTARFNELEPTLGPVTADAVCRHLDKLHELQASGSHPHCEHYSLSDERIQTFRARFSRQP